MLGSVEISAVWMEVLLSNPWKYPGQMMLNRPGTVFEGYAVAVVRLNTVLETI